MTKQLIREEYKTKRMELSKNILNSKSEAICSSFFENFAVTDKIISLFLPIEKQNEVDTYLILDKAIANGAQVGLPRINNQNFGLRHFLFESKEQLIINKFGIPEPKDGQELYPNQFDIVFVPLLALDLTGNRVGYGKGYYDRFLKECRKDCLLIGLHLFDEFIEIDDINQFDIALHYCITPTQIFEF